MNQLPAKFIFEKIILCIIMVLWLILNWSTKNNNVRVRFCIFLFPKKSLSFFHKSAPFIDLKFVSYNSGNNCMRFMRFRLLTITLTLFTISRHVFLSKWMRSRRIDKGTERQKQKREGSVRLDEITAYGVIVIASWAVARIPLNNPNLLVCFWTTAPALSRMDPPVTNCRRVYMSKAESLLTFRP